MKKIKKLLVALLAATLLFSAIPLSAAAASVEDDGIMPLWDNTSAVSCFISFTDDGYGTAEALVLGDDGVTSITCDVYVYKKVGVTWSYVTEGHFSASDDTLLDCCEFAAVKNCSYKADYTITVTKNNVDEVITYTAYEDYN